MRIHKRLQWADRGWKLHTLPLARHIWSGEWSKGFLPCSCLGSKSPNPSQRGKQIQLPITGSLSDWTETHSHPNSAFVWRGPSNRAYLLWDSHNDIMQQMQPVSAEVIWRTDRWLSDWTAAQKRRLSDLLPSVNDADADSRTNVTCCRGSATEETSFVAIPECSPLKQGESSSTLCFTLSIFPALVDTAA